MTTSTAFTDDSSRSLGLDHSPTAKPLRGGDRVATFAGGIQKRDLEERAEIKRNEAEDRERKIRELERREGWTYKQAAEFVDTEAAVPKGKRPRLTRDERREREIIDLMGARRKTKGSSSSKSKFKTVKIGTLVCLECHLECKTCGCSDQATASSNDPQPCSCAPCASYRSNRSKRGRPSTLHRTEHVTARESRETKATISAAGLSESDALEITAAAIVTGRAFPELLEEFHARKGEGASTAA